MNLSKKQIDALVREIYPDVQSKQKQQLVYLTESYKQEIKKFVESNIDFSWVDREYIWAITIKKSRIMFDPDLYSPKQDWYWSTIEIKDEKSANDVIVSSILSDTIKKKFESFYWVWEITKDDIEHEIVLATIWAESIKELISIVKSKLSI